MKVSLSAEGKLSVVAETELESYALSKWFLSYRNKDCDSVLNIDCTSIIEAKKAKLIDRAGDQV